MLKGMIRNHVPRMNWLVNSYERAKWGYNQGSPMHINEKSVNTKPAMDVLLNGFPSICQCIFRMFIGRSSSTG